MPNEIITSEIKLEQKVKKENQTQNKCWLK